MGGGGEGIQGLLSLHPGLSCSLLREDSGSYGQQAFHLSNNPVRDVLLFLPF